jgi:hypothetical protein
LVPSGAATVASRSGSLLVLKSAKREDRRSETPPQLESASYSDVWKVVCLVLEVHAMRPPDRLTGWLVGGLVWMAARWSR